MNKSIFNLLYMHTFKIFIAFTLIYMAINLSAEYFLLNNLFNGYIDFPLTGIVSMDQTSKIIEKFKGLAFFYSLAMFIFLIFSSSSLVFKSPNVLARLRIPKKKIKLNFTIYSFIIMIMTYSIIVFTYYLLTVEYQLIFETGIYSKPLLFSMCSHSFILSSTVYKFNFMNILCFIFFLFITLASIYNFQFIKFSSNDQSKGIFFGLVLIAFFFSSSFTTNDFSVSLFKFNGFGINGTYLIFIIIYIISLTYSKQEEKKLEDMTRIR